MWTVFTGFVAVVIIAYFATRVMRDAPPLEGDRRSSVFGRWLEPVSERFQSRARAAVPKNSSDRTDYIDPLLRPRTPLWLTIVAPFAGAVLFVFIARHSSRHPFRVVPAEPEEPGAQRLGERRVHQSVRRRAEGRQGGQRRRGGC